MRKRRAQGQQAVSGAFLWVFLYAFRSPLWRGLDNLSRLPADHAGKTLSRLAYQRLKCVENEAYSAVRRRSTTVPLLKKAQGISYIAITLSPLIAPLLFLC